MKTLHEPVLELTHNHGTEAADGPAYRTASTDAEGSQQLPDGFGLCVLACPRVRGVGGGRSSARMGQGASGEGGAQLFPLLRSTGVSVLAGHIGFLVDDVYAATDALCELGHDFQKKVSPCARARVRVCVCSCVCVFVRACGRVLAALRGLDRRTQPPRLSFRLRQPDLRMRIARSQPDDGNMKGLAFARDPDGYLVELIKRGWDPSF